MYSSESPNHQIQAVGKQKRGPVNSGIPLRTTNSTASADLHQQHEPTHSTKVLCMNRLWNYLRINSYICIIQMLHLFNFELLYFLVRKSKDLGLGPPRLNGSYACKSWNHEGLRWPPSGRWVVSVVLSWMRISLVRAEPLGCFLRYVFPGSPKTIFWMSVSVKTIVLVGIYNQQFQGTIILMVFDFQGICIFFHPKPAAVKSPRWVV